MQQPLWVSFLCQCHKNFCYVRGLEQIYPIRQSYSHFIIHGKAAVHIKSCWSFVNWSFQISLWKFPLVSPKVSQKMCYCSNWATCNDEKICNVLAHFSSVGGGLLMIDMNSCASWADLCQITHFEFLYALPRGGELAGEELQTGIIADL